MPVRVVPRRQFHLCLLSALFTSCDGRFQEIYNLKQSHGDVAIFILAALEEDEGTFFKKLNRGPILPQARGTCSRKGRNSAPYMGKCTHRFLSPPAVQSHSQGCSMKARPLPVVPPAGRRRMDEFGGIFAHHFETTDLLREVSPHLLFEPPQSKRTVPVGR